MRHAWMTFLIPLALQAAGCGGAAVVEPPIAYPEARRGDVVDDYHGTPVADPYRWLEDAESEETLAWVEAQNELTMQWVRGEHWEFIRNRLESLWNFPRWSLPVERAGLYFYSMNDGLQDQPVVHVQEGLDGTPRVLLDPNTMSADGTVAVTGTEPSPDGKWLAYLASSGGSDWQELRIRSVDTGEDLDDVLDWCKFTSVAWRSDGAGFWYNRFPAEGEVPVEDRNNYSRVYWHALGTSQSEDVLVYERPDHKTLGFSPWVTEDGRWLVLVVYEGTDPRTRIYVRDASDPGAGFIELLDDFDAMYLPVGSKGSTFWFHTDLDAPRGRIIAIDVDDPARDKWKEVVAQRDDVIDEAALVAGHLVVSRSRDAQNVVEILDLEGQVVAEPELPGIGSVRGLTGREEGDELFWSFMSFLQPQTIFRYDFSSGDTEVWREPEIDFDASDYETRQVFFESLDGTEVPMFITHRKGLEKNGENPTLLYGYGGFNIGLTPRFSVSRLVWLENGGVFVSVNLRGGNEYGEEWHEAGTLGNKQNVFDDFIAAAEWLIAEGYTSPDRLASIGGSNGGLLTAACMLQRPDLWGAVVSAVPVIDMLRYHMFSVGRYWVSDYGNAEEDPEHFEFLYEYSPLHNIEKGAAYPAILVTTADTDDRVVPMHAKKFVAALQWADDGQEPILLRVETSAGHGKGKPTSKKIEEAADIYSFLFEMLGVETG